MTTTTPARAVDLPQTARDLAATVLVEQARTFAAELRDLATDDWRQPTDCTRWDVRAVAAHVAGALEDGARLRVMVRHLWQARRRQPGTAQVDAINEAQVADRSGVPGPSIAAEIERLAPRAARARRRLPALVRSRRVGSDDLPPGATLGYVFDVIYARDLWMHRVDVARATGGAMRATDGECEVVEQVVRDLARFWSGPAWVLELTGSTAGTWQVGTGEPVGSVRVDTVGYLRSLSGRPGEPALDVEGPARLVEQVRAARLSF